MTLKHLRLALGLPFLLTACVDAQNLGDPQDTEPGTTDVGPTTSGPSTKTTGVETDTTATDSGVVETDSGGPETETDAASDTETETETDATTGGDPLCSMPDPEVDATFSVEVGEWPIDDEHFFTIETSCTVETVQSGVSVDVELTCDAGETQLPIVLRFAGSDAGESTLEPGLEVAFRYRYEEDWDLGTGIWEALALNDPAGGALLLSGARTGGFTTSEFTSTLPDFDPIVATVDEMYCPVDPFDTLPFRVEFSLGEAAIELISGQRGTLVATEPEAAYAIDLAVATLEVGAAGDSPPETVSLLIREITPE